MRAERNQVWSRLLLRVIGAGLLIATAAMHLDLYLTGYRTIPTIGPLFLLQVIVGFLLAALVLLTGSRVVAAIAAGFALSTLGGYLLTVQFGLFGFREVRTTAGIVAGIIEVLAFAVLAYLAATPGPGALAAGSSRSRSSASSSSAEAAAAAAARRGGVGGTTDTVPGGVHTTATSMPNWLTGGVSPVLAVLGVGAVAIVAFGLLGGALAAAGGSSGSASASTTPGAQLKTASIGGITVLVNGSGQTLYWFAPDTSGKSTCYGFCAQYWPPVAGPLGAGPGVTGTLATTTRTDGTKQETYNGHPLYTYVGDSSLGQDNGNNLNLNGGVWHVVPAQG
jgi:predicted lipoprotein with Yx(FWY)xxD motif